ncbi:MAG TPA: zf-HC2 domain-containing protein [Actinophytocola sp.]|uniref:anti-sigma factor family protein n=1 Tax=Actinophytocola sp. TaxID=1872138 RepID=UPI002DBECCD9|nr:zf-HC2 domain-containing protein [Actinophytocola sp.]HEU5472123.1 zf-HC2 domain-containing protein [Actinophytocola sp.]
MTDRRGGWGLSEQHLLPDAVVAFVDGELSLTAVERATSHIARCPGCAADIAAQRQASAAVQAADSPPVPAGLLATLRAIPQEVELPGSPDGLAVTEDGQLVMVQRPDRAGSVPFGSSTPLGSSPRLGEGRAVLGRFTRRTAQGAGVVVSGLVLGALALVNTAGGPVSEQSEEQPADDRPASNVQPVGYVAHTLGLIAPH